MYNNYRYSISLFLHFKTTLSADISAKPVTNQVNIDTVTTRATTLNPIWCPSLYNKSFFCLLLPWPNWWNIHIWLDRKKFYTMQKLDHTNNWYISEWNYLCQNEILKTFCVEKTTPKTKSSHSWSWNSIYIRQQRFSTSAIHF